MIPSLKTSGTPLPANGSPDCLKFNPLKKQELGLSGSITAVFHHERLAWSMLG
jgi:hypothetical protein